MKYITIILFLIGSVSVYSQVIDIGTKWTYDYILPIDPEDFEGQNLTIVREIVGDTTINEKVYFVLRNIDYYFFRIEGRKWYWFINGKESEQLLYDFSLEAGDTLKILNLYDDYGIDSLVYRINEVSTQNINGIDFKVQHIEELVDATVFLGNSLIENLGGSDDVLPIGAFEMQIREGLRCVDYSDGFEVRLGEDGLCTNIFTSTDDRARSEFTNSPNPCKDILNIETKELFDNVAIYNSAGMLVLQKDFQPQFFIDHLPQGLFVVKLSNENMAIYKKIMKL